MAGANKFGNYVLWDAIERSGQSEKMHIEAAEFGVQHTFTIIEKNNEMTNFYHFANDSSDTKINQVYIANLDLLRVFIQHFNENVAKSSLLSSAYDLKFNIDPLAEGFTTKSDDIIFDKARAEFLTYMNKPDDKPKLLTPKFAHNDIYLSKRESECLYLYARGKIARDIAIMLGLSRRTVEHYLDKVKTKMGVASKNELIEKFFENLEDKMLKMNCINY